MTQSTQEQPQEIFRGDYQSPDYTIDSVDLNFDLRDDETIVTSTMQLRRLRDGVNALVLDGEDLELKSVQINGDDIPSEQYETDDKTLTIHNVPEQCTLQTVVAIKPQDNTSLSGLYMSSGNYCTQCEAMGFRHITYFLDRPDVMATFTCRVTADKERFPILLSNGNRISSEDLADGLHAVQWEDPFPKPSYLFALVAGNLQKHAGTYQTMSGRNVDLEIWVEPQNIDKCEHALISLQKSMQWDEEAFGREYDLDLYMIVAVNDFNMGAMENKGLNIFNSKYVLAKPETATDTDYEGIEGVIGHEYFHNWTGNRVTCRDWFQLTLKEGLTVFRDQQFTADMTSHLVKRIDDVRSLRIRQFPEDAGPMSHPIRPDSYISMDNFYTMTVYEKGAEIIRMYHTLLGADGFRKGMDLYFERHDGQAVTCDDFLAAMADANQADLNQFSRWYSQRGTPHVAVEANYDEQAQTLRLGLAQSIPVLKEDEQSHLPLHIPLAIGLLGTDGADQDLCLAGEKQEASTYVYSLTENTAEIIFEQVTSKPVISLGRGFSAPVIFDFDQSQEDLVFLMANDSDGFNRWQAGQTLANQLIMNAVQQIQSGSEVAWPDLYLDAFGSILSDDSIDGSFKALMLQLPSEMELALLMDCIDPDAIHAARNSLQKAIVARYAAEIQAQYKSLIDTGPYQATSAAIHARRLKNTLLALLVAGAAEGVVPVVEQQYAAANNMTDSSAALSLLCRESGAASEKALAAFYDSWQEDPLVLDKWFTMQACSPRADVVNVVRDLIQHERFTWGNPNRVRSLLGAFCMANQLRFHAADGSGYEVLGDAVAEVQAKNPQLAARLVSAFNQWRRFDQDRQALQKAQLQRIAAIDGLSKDVFEIVSRALK